jgi:diguanylate cyclase (GGDEF)-like protein/PAS domain S-box-containing protein
MYRPRRRLQGEGHGRGADQPSNRLLSLGDLRLDRRLRWILALYVVLIGGIVGYNANAIAKERGSALIVNVAARQRALAERYMKDVILRTQGIQADPQDDEDQLSVNADALLSGGEVVAVQGADSTVHIPAASSDSKVIDKLLEERRLIDLLIPAGNQLMELKPTDPGYQEKVLALRIVGGQVTIISNDAVGQMTRDTEAAFGRLVAIGIVLGVLGAIVAVGMALILRRLGARRSAQFRSLVNNASDLITVVNDEGRVLYQSPSVERLVGLGADAVVGTDYMDLVDPGDQEHVRALFREGEFAPGGAATGEYRMRHSDGSTCFVESIVTSLMTDPTVKGLVLNTRDVTDRKALEEELAHQAFHDSLTGLSNRAVFRDRVDHALARAARSGHRLTVLLLDLDGFKMINDSLGHDAGDELLVAVGARIEASARTSDTVARLGGDEFALLLEDEEDAAQAKAAAARLLKALAPPFQIRGREIFVRGSVGIAISSSVPVSTDELIRNADTAMYVAKSEGKGRYEIFQPIMHARALQQFEIQAELQQALIREEFVVHYQPIINLDTGVIGGAEALVRWQHPGRGLLPPIEFIGIAEDTGLIVGLGMWVLEEACRQTVVWRTQYPGASDMMISVNLSTRQLLEPDLVSRVRDVLVKTGLEPSALTLELTEGSLMQDVGHTVMKLQGLKKLGVRLAIDDFGTGSSSLGYLRQFPIDLLKIDKSFVDDITTAGSQGSALVRAIITMARTLEMETVAEGIEVNEQLSELRADGCHSGQGYLFARPLRSDAMESFLQQGGIPVAEALFDEETPANGTLTSTVAGTQSGS